MMFIDRRFSPRQLRVTRTPDARSYAENHQVLDIVIGSVLALNREKHCCVRNAIVIEIAND